MYIYIYIYTVVLRSLITTLHRSGTVPVSRPKTPSKNATLSPSSNNPPYRTFIHHASSPSCPHDPPPPLSPCLHSHPLHPICPHQRPKPMRGRQIHPRLLYHSLRHGPDAFNTIPTHRGPVHEHMPQHVERRRGLDRRLHGPT